MKTLPKIAKKKANKREMTCMPVRPLNSDLKSRNMISRGMHLQEVKVPIRRLLRHLIWIMSLVNHVDCIWSMQNDLTHNWMMTLVPMQLRASTLATLR
jgi:hypothetical protein